MATNHSLVAVFRELAQLATLDEGSSNAFRVRAYENAVEAIASFPGDLKALSERELTAIDGIGSGSARKIREFFEKGTVAKLEELRMKYPPEFVALGRIPGIGPKTLLRLRDELGVTQRRYARRGAGRERSCARCRGWARRWRRRSSSRSGG